jgi:ATP-dependent Clp protease ATP-binding subunit ClpA
VTDRCEGADVQDVLEGAEECAAKAHANEVLPEHLLLALVRSRPGALRALFERHRLTETALLSALPALVLPEGHASGVESNGSNGVGPLPPSPDLAALLARTRVNVSSAQSSPRGPEDLLLALAADGTSRASQVLSRRFHLSLEALEKALAPPKVEHEPLPPPHLAAASAGGVGLAAELRALEVRVDALSARERKSQRRLSLLTFLVVVLALALGAVNGLLFLQKPPFPE